MQVSIVLPTYNEKENLTLVIQKLLNVFDDNRVKGNIIIVDDNSPDNTGILADQIAKREDRVQVIHREGKMGLGTAYVTGFKHALENNMADLVFSMDCDQSHDPAYIPDFIDMHLKGYDIVVGSRYISGGGVENWGIHRRIMSKGANLLSSTVLGIKVKDMTTGYRCYAGTVLKDINMDSITSNGYSFLEEILFMCNKRGFIIGETPIVFIDRTLGSSKLSKNEMWKFFLTLIRLKLK
ncbi:polyprenol monophosphomannose synthase [uncultured Methanomethylovorans sp.]|uniref:polyprenol monophosphomannose synthase n=1 Tax=uncultured Methanomethylovorans sp. TaxID=183759 RepID=UPI002AA87B83|nr:polyprenol monophosphomannose synthase [uncultured Methanomethylovorans sp.]